MNNIFKNNHPNIIKGIEIIIFELGNLQKNESVGIISDENTHKIGNYFELVLNEKKCNVKHVMIKSLKSHGERLPKSILKLMKESDLIIGLTEFSMAHSKERITSEQFGTRYLSLPDYSEELLKHSALRVNFKKLGKNSMILSKILSKGKIVKIKTNMGTDLTIDITGRKGNFAPGYVNKKIKLGSPPDIESNIAPIENKSNGKIVVDGSIPHPKIGILKSPIILKINKGKIISIDGEESILKNIFKIIKRKNESVFLGEFGIGLNNKAKLTGNMLLDEGCLGTIHFGFGSNIALGGKIKTDYHLDFVIKSNYCIIDDEKIEFKKLGKIN